MRSSTLEKKQLTADPVPKAERGLHAVQGQRGHVHVQRGAVIATEQRVGTGVPLVRLMYATPQHGEQEANREKAERQTGKQQLQQSLLDGALPT